MDVWRWMCVCVCVWMSHVTAIKPATFPTCKLSSTVLATRWNWHRNNAFFYVIFPYRMITDRRLKSNCLIPPPFPLSIHIKIPHEDSPLISNYDIIGYCAWGSCVGGSPYLKRIMRKITPEMFTIERFPSQDSTHINFAALVTDKPMHAKWALEISLISTIKVFIKTSDRHSILRVQLPSAFTSSSYHRQKKAFFHQIWRVLLQW